MSPLSRSVICIISFFLLLSVVSYAAEETEQTIAARDLPAAVQAAFQRDYPKVKILKASHETENGEELFEIECKSAGVKRDVIYKPDGSLVVVEEVMRVKDLPFLVVKGVKDNYPHGSTKKAEKITRGGEMSYELVVKSGGKTYELAVAVDGRITKTEEKTGKNDD